MNQLQGRAEAEVLAYDPRCERLDTAVRAIVALCTRKGKWSLAEQLGLSRADHFDAIVDALDAIEDIRSEEGIFELVARCPFLVEPAQLAVALYQGVTYQSRQYHYRRTAA